jgi:Bacterial extracellular solute-binding protein
MNSKQVVEANLSKFLARSALAITLAGVPAKANAQSIDELYQAAKKEGALSLNGGGLAGLYEPWVREFEQRFPGIKVKLTADFSNILAPIIDREIAERKLSVDLTIFQTLQDYDRWKKQGVLMSFKPEGWDQIHQSFKDPDGQYVGVAVYALSYAYNTQAIAGIDVPRSAQDFLKPEFNGKVITCYPNDDDVTLYLFYTIVQKYGWEFMDKYMANNPQWVRGHLGTARAVASGQAAVTFDTMTNVTLGLKKNNQPTDVAFSDVDPLPVWPPRTPTRPNSTSPGFWRRNSKGEPALGRRAWMSLHRQVSSRYSTINLPMTFAASSLMRSSPKTCVSGSRVISASRKASR